MNNQSQNLAHKMTTSKQDSRKLISSLSNVTQSLKARPVELRGNFSVMKDSGVSSSTKFK
jgi:hypothetical protein